MSIQDHLDLLHVTEPAELLIELSLGGVEAEPEDSDAFARVWFLSVPYVSTSVRHRTTGGVTTPFHVRS